MARWRAETAAHIPQLTYGKIGLEYLQAQTAPSEDVCFAKVAAPR